MRVDPGKLFRHITLTIHSYTSYLPYRGVSCCDILLSQCGQDGGYDLRTQLRSSSVVTTLASSSSWYGCNVSLMASVTPSNHTSSYINFINSHTVPYRAAALPMGSLSAGTAPLSKCTKRYLYYVCGPPYLRTRATSSPFLPPATPTATTTQAQPYITWATTADWGSTLMLTLAGLWGLRLLSGPQPPTSNSQAPCSLTNSNSHTDSIITQRLSCPTIKPTAGLPTARQTPNHILWIKTPQYPSIFISINLSTTTVAALKLRINQAFGVPTILSARWQGKHLDQKLEDTTLAEIGLIHNDTIHFNMPIKGGMQPKAWNPKRTFVLDDTDSDEFAHCLPTTTSQTPFADDGSVGKISETESIHSQRSSYTDVNEVSETKAHQWQPRLIKRRPIMSKLSTRIYLSNDTLRVRP